MLDALDNPVIRNLLSAFNNAMEKQDPTNILAQFHEDCHWRDLIAFTWNINAMNGKETIKEMLDAQLCRIAP